jgi:hypothetical protein
MSADHKQTAAADARLFACRKRPMDRAVLTKDVAVADHRNAGMFRHVHVLRHSAEHGAFQHEIVAAQHRARFHRYTAGQMAAVAQHHARFHYAEGADAHVGSKLGMRANDGKRVNRHGGSFPRRRAAYLRATELPHGVAGYGCRRRQSRL